MTELKNLLKKHKYKISILVVVVFIALGFMQPLELTVYEINDAFDLKILHVSDFHDYKFDKKKIEEILQSQPDMIAFTGDMIDRNRYDLENMKAFVNQFKGYPMFYVTGNHEAANGHLDEVIETLEALGVQVLQNEVAMFKGIQIIGVHDQIIGEQYPVVDDGPKILLVHRASRIERYKDQKINLILSGHAHGGQWRLFNQGMISPDQGVFPKYSSGVYLFNDTKAIVNRGLGNSILPLRWYNGPEIILIHVKSIY